MRTFVGAVASKHQVSQVLHLSLSQPRLQLRQLQLWGLCIQSCSIAGAPGAGSAVCCAVHRDSPAGAKSRHASRPYTRVRAAGLAGSGKICQHELSTARTGVHRQLCMLGWLWNIFPTLCCTPCALMAVGQQVHRRPLSATSLGQCPKKCLDIHRVKQPWLRCGHTNRQLQPASLLTGEHLQQL
jgi:hypothetical protein